MPLLFSYGTLQQPAVQQATFGRSLDGHPDELPGYHPSLVPIEDPSIAADSGATHHANASYTGEQGSRISGTVFEVTEAELAAADQYERPAAYQRRSVTLTSGRQAWVYVHVPPG